ncbi:MAG: hypothetical protein AB8H80_22390 [Planctomycetota bacterium]
MPRPLRRSFPQLLLELSVVVLGITISFWLQDWRQARHERAEESRLLKGFAMELELDQLELEQRGKALEMGIASIRDLLEKGSELDEKTIDHGMDAALGYMSFSPSMATYLELRQTGASRLIQDKDLLRNLIMLYERAYAAATEWDQVNRTFVLDRMFPHIERFGPSFAAKIEGAFAHGYHKVFRALEPSEHFRNLLHNGSLFKEGQRVVYDQLRTATARIVKRLQDA